MNTKHTPGPWSINARASTSVVSMAGERGICSTGGYQNNFDDPENLNAENEANARLIAAAPEMLEALRGISHVLEAVGWYPCSQEDADDEADCGAWGDEARNICSSEEWRTVLAVIAKASGEED